MTGDLPFARYTRFSPAVPVHCVTPEESSYIHRFYDSSPFSPSGRYLAVTRLPFEDRRPRPGESTEIAVVDLVTGEHRIVAETRAWDVQLGAQLQWGADDRTLLFNDLEPNDWIPFGIRLNPFSGQRMQLGGTVYSVSPDGRRTASSCLRRIAVTQAGYGAVVPREQIPKNRGAPADDGIYITDLESGQTRLLVSIRQIVREAMPALEGMRCWLGDFYGFHVKWNPQGTRLMFVLRWLPRGSISPEDARRRRANQVITLDADGSNPRVAVSARRWARGGHHPNWCPDGEHVLMNLNTCGDGLRFARLSFDGASCETLVPSIQGSGHPTLHPDARHLITDAYLGERSAYGDGTVPIRLIDLRSGVERTLVRIRTRPEAGSQDAALRVDPHPAWDRRYSRIAFNACPLGYRQVFVADLRAALAGEPG